ncbi:transcriptional regulator TyrR [Thalassotalea piscium]|uniref:HTH-type transcriptional regulatory protein TyrR n=1 Tax=Thalassotalea piscium TaxID=1230533 RepID=A0A7X0NH74_9GAMM|nr:transcriptional regulator TyrR [Thalassotalea piscium]MBB6543402.1 transcriptional regulator of aroF, aroG, tyrA and aromatic amino acid transport [Thalassotalea piscium]
MRLEIGCQDRVGIAQDVLRIFVEREIDLRGIELRRPGKIYINIPDLEFSELQSFMPQLRLIEGVVDVKTTKFMPFERERHELETLIKTFPDPFISIDGKGNIRMINNVAAFTMGSSEKELVGEHIGNWLKGFNFNRWLDAQEVLAQTRRVKIHDDDFVADIMPIHVSDNEGEQVLAGAVLILKSEARLGQQISAFKQANENNFAGIQASSGAMRKVIREAKRMALLDSSMLIIGETGTGKELIARACHAASDRAERPFMTLNCASLPDEAAETELFGVGVPGGVNSKRGLFELADGGSIFLDGVGEMSPKLQTKLLRVIQDGIFRRVDDESEINVNVRIIGSTNRDLLAMVAKGEFREDLYYRLNVLGLNIPSLRERRSDIIPLAEFFTAKFGQRIGKSVVSLSDDCRDFIEHYPWPGNVRQLENVLIRAVSLMEGHVVMTSHLQLPAYTREHGYLEQEFEGTLDAAVKSYEADLLRKLYPAYPSTRQLAKKLGLSHTAIANKLREYDINKKTVKI